MAGQVAENSPHGGIQWRKCNSVGVNYRTLGRTGLRVSEIGFGAWGIGGRQWLGGSDTDSLAALRRALELGINFIDTALAYNEGHSERLIAQTLNETGASAVVATKVPPMNRIWPARAGVGIEDVFPYRYVIESTETSLRNLGRETIDLQQLHVWNPEWITSPQSARGQLQDTEGRGPHDPSCGQMIATDEWRRALEDLKRSGKVRFIGVSINDHQPDSALQLIETGLIDTVQVIYNVFDQTPEYNLFPTCLKHNVGVLARVPLDEGSLTGAVTESTEFDPTEFRAMYFRGDRKAAVVKRLERLLPDLDGEPVAEAALRFSITPAAVSASIPGMRRIRNVESNVRACGRGVLPPEKIAKLRKHLWVKNFYQ